MTRKDLLTGKNVSLLVFIRSRFDMRKIFDADSISVSSSSQSETLDSKKEEIELQIEETIGEAEFHLRQQILF